MPKTEYPLLDFSGGLSNNSNGRDIADNELRQADDIVVDDIGKIKTIGGFTSSITSVNLATIDDIQSGYGLFVFGTDYELTSGGGLVFIAIAGYALSSDNFICRILELSSDYSIYSTTIELNTTDNSGFLPVFYYIDGGLRICDGGLSSNSKSKWFGYIKRTHFSSSHSYAAYYSKDVELASPTAGLVGTLNGTATDGNYNTLTDTGAFQAAWDSELDSGGDNDDYQILNLDELLVVGVTSRTDINSITTDTLSGGGDDADWFFGDGDVWYLLPPPGEGFNLDITATGSDGSWDAGDYEFATSFIYDNTQESLLYKLVGDDITLTTGQGFSFYVYPCTEYNQRISGGRIYTRLAGSNDAWTMLCDIDMHKGCRISFDSEYEGWYPFDLTITNTYYQENALVSNEPNPDTYESINGFNSDNVDTLEAGYKTAVVANRMAYIGNVLYDGVKYEDAIFKSYVNRFDTFTLDRRLEILRGDGESIIKLEEFADRILVFKEQTMYILNVSQEIEFLEAKYEFRGVKYPYQTVRTEYGVAWANEFGVYLYDGQQVYDLLLDRQNTARRKINMNYWQSFWDSTGSIAFDPNEKRLILLANITSTSNENIMLYSLTTGSWTRGVDKLPLASHKYSNIVNSIGNGDMIVYDATDKHIYKWSNTAVASTNIVIVSKDIIFGALIPDKRFYGVNITHRYAGTGMYVSYSIDGGNTYTNIDLMTNSDTYIKEEFRLSTPVSCKSVIIRIANSALSSLEIDDISLLYRMKGVR